MENTNKQNQTPKQTVLTQLIFEMMKNIPNGFERRAFIRAAHYLLQTSTHIPISFRAGSRRPETKRQRLISLYLKEITKFTTRQSDFTMQAIFPSNVNVTHSVSVEGYEWLIDMIVHKLDIFAKVVDLKSMATSLVLCILNVWANLDRPATVILSISQFLMNLQLGQDVLTKAMSFFQNLFEQFISRIQEGKESLISHFTLHSFVDEFDLTSVVPLMGGGLSVLLSLVFLRIMPGTHTFDAMFMRFSRLSGVIRSAADVSKLFGGTITAALDDLCFKAFGVERPVMDEWKNIREWTTDVTKLITPDFENDLKGNEQLKQSVDSLLTQGMSILRTLDALKVPLSERSAVNQCVMFLMRARETAGGCGAGQTKPRVAPAITHIFGDSGVGKSTVLWALIAEIQAALGVTKPSDLHEKTYFRRPGAKFWDGYNNAVNVVVCDDFGALVDSESKPNEEFLEAIHMSNTAFWQLNMAELSDKRSTYFQAKSVIWTSNRSHFSVTSLTNPEAVLRRIDLKIRQKPHPNFKKIDKQGGVDVDILDQAKVDIAIKEHGTSAMLNCVLFDVIDKADPNDKVLEGDLSFAEIAERVVTKTLQNMNYFENFNNALTSHMQDAIDRCVGGKWVKPDFTVHCGETSTQTIDVTKLEPHRSISDYYYNLRHVSPDKFLFDFDMVDPTKVKEPTRDWVIQDLPNLHRNNRMYEQAKFRDISETDAFLAANVVKSSCFHVEHSKLIPFVRCWTRAKRAFILLRVREQTDKAFINLYVQSCKILTDGVIPIKDSEMCDYHFKGDSLWSRVRFDLPKNFDDLNAKIEYRFGMSPQMFYALAGLSTLAISFIGVKLYNKLKLYFSKTTIHAMNRFESNYDVGVTNAQRAMRNTMESYCSDTTKTLPSNRVESYSTDVTKNMRRSKVEVGFLGDTSPKGHTNYYGQKYEDLSLMRKIMWKLGHANVKPAQDVMSKIAGKFTVQAVIDQNAAEVVDVVHRNMYILEFFLNGKWEHALNITIIRGRIALMNKHIQLHQNKDLWRIRNNHFKDGIEFNLWNCKNIVINDPNSIFYRRDAMLVELPREVHQHKDIVHKFMTGDDFSRFRTLEQISMIGYVPKAAAITMRQYFGSDVEAADQEMVADDGNKPIMTLRRLFKYNIQSTPGDCGAVLVAFDKHFSNKVIGIHCGGTEAARFTGFGTPVTSGFLNEMLHQLDLKYPESLMFPDLECDETVNYTVESSSDNSCDWYAELPFEGNFAHLGTSPERIHVHSTSKIVPSPIYGVIQEPTMAPARLGKFKNDEGIIVDPMASARVKASPLSKPLDSTILATCMSEYFQTLITFNGDQDKKILTYEEGIKGIEGDVMYAPMNRRTSPGFGWIKSGLGKTKWLGDGEYILDNPELKERHDALLTKCKLGQRPSIVWTDTLKDERRTLEKVAKGKTRLFSCGEMAYTLLFRQYFSGFMAFIMRNKINNESCVGTNVYSMDWTRIAEKLEELGDNILAGDFANYDGTLHPAILWAICDLINSWYGSDNEEDNLIRISLWSEVVNSIHITDNKFYMWNHSQPSGCPITVILNCVYHSISARYVYISCARKSAPTEISLQNFRKNVRHLNYGDDDLWSISPRIIEWFNQVTITEAYLELGMTYTDEAKTGEIVPFRHLSDVNFLKRTFRWDNEQCRYRAPLALETIREMAMWNHGTLDSYELTASILQDAVHELAQHDLETFNREIGAFERAAEIVRRKHSVFFESYQDYQVLEYINQVQN